MFKNFEIWKKTFWRNITKLCITFESFLCVFQLTIKKPIKGSLVWPLPFSLDHIKKPLFIYAPRFWIRHVRSTRKIATTKQERCIENFVLQDQYIRPEALRIQLCRSNRSPCRRDCVPFFLNVWTKCFILVFFI